MVAGPTALAAATGSGSVSPHGRRGRRSRFRTGSRDYRRWHASTRRAWSPRAGFAWRTREPRIRCRAAARAGLAGGREACGCRTAQPDLARAVVAASPFRLRQAGGAREGPCGSDGLRQDRAGGVRHLPHRARELVLPPAHRRERSRGGVAQALRRRGGLHASHHVRRRGALRRGRRCRARHLRVEPREVARAGEGPRLPLDPRQRDRGGRCRGAVEALRGRTGEARGRREAVRALGDRRELRTAAGSSA